MIKNTPLAWRLKKSEEKRVRQGHPWVFSNEIQGSPKGVTAGQKLELQAASGEFIAYGYANPTSLIAFRVVSRVIDEADALENVGIQTRLKAAKEMRESLGLTKSSHRLFFAEADSFPGLVIDRYLTENADESIFAIQAHTAGVDTRLEGIQKAITKLYPSEKITFVIHRDLSHRKQEGIEDHGISVEGAIPKELLRDVRVKVGDVFLSADLVGGQKTGLFLDQTFNQSLFLNLLNSEYLATKKEVRILDLCSYVGQWSATLSHYLKQNKKDAVVTCFDASEKALAFAAKNVREAGAKEVNTVKGDLLTDLKRFTHGSFDVVIVDPPALIQNRKSIPQGKQAYFAANRDALGLLAKNGRIVSCSCSSLLSETELRDQLSKSENRAGVNVAWTYQGSQSPDHPTLACFPEGKYLKAFMGVRIR